MRVRGRDVPPHLVPLAALVLFLAVIAVVGSGPGVEPVEADAAGASAHDRRQRASEAGRRTVPPPPLPPGGRWSGFAFDACRTPSQHVMDRWRTTSPFTGVGIYLGGVHRACEQRHLTPRWVSRQVRSGWKLLPIWVGPQASCTGYDHRIVSRPGRRERYGEARSAGVRQARGAAAAARALDVPRGSVIFYDIEPFRTDLERCRRSSLAFLEEWTEEMHRRGYRSGVYSHVNSAISLLSRTGPGYTRPDATWYAWIDRVGSVPREHIAPTFMRSNRVHQYLLDTWVEFGGIRMAIDWDFVNLGAVSRPVPPIGCDQRAARVRPRPLRPGDRGPDVRVVQCLLPGERHPTKTSGRYDPPTQRAVRTFQQRRGLRPTGAVDRRTWVSLLARGGSPALEKGDSGDPVRRLQRTLKVALGRSAVQVDGAFGKETARAVRHYRTRLGMRSEAVVTDRVWRALTRGRIVLPRGHRRR